MRATWELSGLNLVLSNTQPGNIWAVGPKKLKVNTVSYMPLDKSRLTTDQKLLSFGQRSKAHHLGLSWTATLVLWSLYPSLQRYPCTAISVLAVALRHEGLKAQSLLEPALPLRLVTLTTLPQNCLRSPSVQVCTLLWKEALFGSSVTI